VEGTEAAEEEEGGEEDEEEEEEDGGQEEEEEEGGEEAEQEERHQQQEQEEEEEEEEVNACGSNSSWASPLNEERVQVTVYHLGVPPHEQPRVNLSDAHRAPQPVF